MLLQAILVESGTLRFALFELVKYQSAGYSLDRVALEGNLNEVVRYELVRGRDSTAAWAVWCCIVLRIKLHRDALNVLSESRDKVVALLVLDALSKDLTEGNIDTDNWSGFMSKVDLRSENWLLAYEANIKGWLPSVTDEDHVNLDEAFGFLKEREVSFYRHQADKEYKRGVVSGAVQLGLTRYG
jgi:hypothetical protein